MERTERINIQNMTSKCSFMIIVCKYCGTDKLIMLILINNFEDENGTCFASISANEAEYRGYCGMGIMTPVLPWPSPDTSILSTTYMYKKEEKQI